MNIPPQLHQSPKAKIPPTPSPQGRRNLAIAAAALLLTGTAPALAADAIDGPLTLPDAALSPRFSCQTIDGRSVVTYSPESEPDRYYPWAVPQDLGGGWTANRRCVEIARRLETYRPDGLVALEAGQENGYNTVCATSDRNPTCRIVFTVPPGQDPYITRDQVFSTLAQADSGETTTGVLTFQGGRWQSDVQDILDGLGIDLGLDLGGSRDRAPSRRDWRPSTSLDLRPFLDRADGGTGERLY
ncbi:MAG: COP23 domain-containing protein [Cyanobacteria bacterium]|nr:COP23 domain-containing protein [Cyanobacteriota bacterium]